MDNTIALIHKSHNGDERARAQLVEENSGLVWCIVRKFSHRGIEADDLFQIGNIGLLKAIDRFDESFHVRFSTYAVPVISGEMKRYLRDEGPIKVSRSIKELAYKVYKEKDRISHLTDREATLGEVAEALGVDKEEVVMAMEASMDIESLQKISVRQDGQEIRLMDRLPEKDSQEEKMINHILLKELLASLKKEERQLIFLRYFADQTQSQVGEVMGISQVQVSRMEKKILSQLREKLLE